MVVVCLVVAFAIQVTAEKPAPNKLSVENHCAVMVRTVNAVAMENAPWENAFVTLDSREIRAKPQRHALLTATDVVFALEEFANVLLDSVVKLALSWLMVQSA